VTESRSDTRRWVANLTLLFTELSLQERAAAARGAGFDEVEFWWPFGDRAMPSADEVDAFCDSIERAGVVLTAMNLFAGDMPAGERGVLSYPERTDEFRASVEVALAIGERMGTKLFNAPYGHRRLGLDRATQDGLADANLAFAARRLHEIGAMVLMEPVSGMPDYAIRTAEDAVGVLDRVARNTGVTNLGFLLDQYHLAMNGVDLPGTIDRYGPRAVHVQLADTPGRGEPGSGDADIRGVVLELEGIGYDGAFALEFMPPSTTTESLKQWNQELASWAAA